MSSSDYKPVLVGSTFPLSLIRAKVTIEPSPLKELQAALHTRPWASFWGHDNTMELASKLVGVDLKPPIKRPAIELDSAGYPTLHGTTYDECWVLSPDYLPGYRPEIGQELAAEKIKGWQTLRMLWRV